MGGAVSPPHRQHRFAPPRAILLFLSLLAHGVAICLLLSHRTVRPPVQAGTAIALFDLTLPPPPPPPVTPPPAPPRVIQPRVVENRPEPVGIPKGGSAAPVAERVVAADAPAAPRWDATIVADAPALPTSGPASAGSGIDLGGTGGTGTGSGSSAGSGSGSGSGSGAPLVPTAWLRQPTLADFMRVWPSNALRLKLSGRVMLRCWLKRSGRPERCTVVSETPAGAAFGTAALKVSPLFRLRPVTRANVVQQDIPIYVPVAFDYAAK